MKRCFSIGVYLAIGGLVFFLAGCDTQQQPPPPQTAQEPKAPPTVAEQPKAEKPMAPIITPEETKSAILEGQKLAITYCQACHYFEGTDQAGTVAPPLLVMKQRFPERQKLENIIHDPHVATKPDSMMPPFGRNGLLDEKQIALIIDFLYTL